MANGWSVRLALLVVGSLGFATAAQAQVHLTGAVQFDCDSSGSVGGAFWNTLGGDGTSFNLYLTSPNSGIGGGFINSGDGPSTSIDVALAVGTHQFFMFGDVASVNTHAGLNLFLAGDNVNPALSAFAALDFNPPAGFPTFAANSAALTYALNLSLHPGAGTLTAYVGGLQITLTDYHWSHPSVNLLDRVGPFAALPDGLNNDSVGSFTLTVTPTPEPAGILAMTVFGVGGAVWFRRRIRRNGTSGKVTRRRLPPPHRAPHVRPVGNRRA